MPGISKPTALKVLEGNRGRRELPVNEPKPRPKAPRVEKSIDKEAKKIARELAPKLERVGLLTEVDGFSFAALCQTVARLRAIWKKLQKEGSDLIVTESIYLKGVYQGTREKPNPLLKLESDYMKLLCKQAAEFGLTPRGRAGLTIGRDKDDTEGAELLTQ
jgi:P27 family predicted phage terminase small subunit